MNATIEEHNNNIEAEEMNNKEEIFDEFDLTESKDLEYETLDLKDPFDPKEIDIQVQSTTLDNLIKRLKHNEIDFYPDFQRGPDLWKKPLQRRLIESLLIKLPIPAFYFDATDDEKWQIIDGLQRLSSIKHFVIDNTLLLKDMEYLTELVGKTFNDLPRPLQRRIEEAPVTLYLIKPGTPKEVKYSLFYRINTGGLTLNPQEIRHALSQSVNSAQASTFLKKLSELEIFQKCTRVSNRRMLDKELILRYIAFKLNPFGDYKGPMFKFLNDTMEVLGNLEPSKLESLEKEFEKSVSLSWEIFGEDAFRKSILEENVKRKVVNRALFEVVTVAFSNLDDDEIAVIRNNKDNFIKEYLKLLKEAQFDETISISTTYAKNIVYRFEKFENLVSTHLSKESIIK